MDPWASCPGSLDMSAINGSTNKIRTHKCMCPLMLFALQFALSQVQPSTSGAPIRETHLIGTHRLLLPLLLPR